MPDKPIPTNVELDALLDARQVDARKVSPEDYERIIRNIPEMNKAQLKRCLTEGSDDGVRAIAIVELNSRSTSLLICIQVGIIFLVMMLSVMALVYFLPSSAQASLAGSIVESSEGNKSLVLSFMHKSSTLLILVIIVAGCMGGLANFLKSERKSLKKDGDPTVYLWRCMILSMSASACVPLFLNIIQSDLIRKTPYDSNTYFSFLGFCILAAFTSKRFIDSLAERALKTANETKDNLEKTKVELMTVKAENKESINEINETQAHLEANIDRNSEGTPLDVLQPLENAEDNIELDERMLKVLATVEDSRYAFRTTKGIAKDCNLSQDVVNGCLSWLMRKKLVNQSKRTKGWRWYITANGRAHLGLEPKGPANLFSEQ